MLRRLVSMLVVLPLLAAGLAAQGLDTRATKDDWEEINFEFNSSVLADGFPSLLRLAELLQKNPGHKVSLEGHTDIIGNNRSNDRLGLARATTVRDFLVKYGARPNQIALSSRGKVDPKYPGQRSTYGRTDEARWMNRRVVVTVMDEQGKTVSAAGVGEAIRAIEPPKPAPQPQGVTDCCSEVLRRLDKLDDIAKLLKDLADQNAALRKDLDGLKQGQQALESRVNQPPPPPPPSTQEVANAVAKEIDQRKDPRFQLLGVNIGADGNGDATFSGKGRFFAPFGPGFAFQAQAEYLYFRTQKEGQIDFGLIDRLAPRFQAGLFASFKHVTLSGNQSGGTLGQAALTLDYVMKRGRIGLFGTKGFMDNALINREMAVLPNGVVSPDLVLERYLRTVDQVGLSGSIGLWGNNYAEGNAGFLKSVGNGDHFGGTLRFVFPLAKLSNKIAITVEGGINETLIGGGNSGRAVVGLQFGNSLRPKEFLGTDRPIPVDVPRVRYEVLTRTVRIGHTPPVADAGPNQIGVSAGTITLNGSNSYSPDGLPITFKWTQESGPAVALSSPTSAITTFTAAADQTYSFRLVVTDSLNGQSAARVSVTTQAARKAQVLFFIANPTQIQPGQQSTLSWNVTGADNVTITGQGNVSLTGSIPVSPTATTTYTLTATAPGGNATATATITVTSPQTKLLFCYATPTNIIAGESARLFYQSDNATSVSITPGFASAALGGSVAVTPTQTTTYTITATGASASSTDSCTVAVTVTPGQVPRILRFSANPATINSGQSSTLLWAVENATTVSITSLNNVTLTGSQDVTPAATTLYTLTATNAAGSVTAQATVTVNTALPPPPTITSFTATPPTSPSPGSAVVLSCQTTNATSINLNGQTFQPPTATLTVNPPATTTYTCIAIGQNGLTASKTVTVTVPGTGTGGGGQGPVIVIAGGANLTTVFRQLTIDASGSFSPAGNNPLTFEWNSVDNTAAIVNANSSKPSIILEQIGGGLGQVGGVYLFHLTVTDSKGNATTQTITVNFTP